MALDGLNSDAPSRRRRRARHPGRTKPGPLSRTALKAFLEDGDREQIKREISAARLQATAEAIDRGLKRGNMRAARMVLELAGLIGAETQVAIAIVQQLGVPLDAAKKAIAYDQEAASMPVAEQAARAVRWLIWWRGVEPEEFERIAGNKLCSPKVNSE